MENRAESKRKHVKKSVCYFLRRAPGNISRISERAFYQLGLRIAERPYSWLTGSTLVVLLCLAGLLNFRQEKNPLKLWVPPDSDFLHDTEWLMKSFREGMRVESIMITGDNVLEPSALLKLNKITKRIFNSRSYSEDGKNISWTDVCFKVPVVPPEVSDDLKIEEEEDDIDDSESTGNVDPVSWVLPIFYCRVYNRMDESCYVKSILDIWNYDDDIIGNLTTEDILKSLKTVVASPSLGHPIDWTELLGGLTRDENGEIIGAKAVKTEWFLKVNFSSIDMDKTGNDMGTADWASEDTLEWEKAFLKSAKESTDELELGESLEKSSLAIWYESARSFGDISSSTMFQDFFKIAAGFILMSVYVQIILSRFNWVEWRFCLTAAGLLCVGGAFIIAVGVCSVIGIPYGPVHTSLPFMLMGLGVDDIFVMMASWDRVNSEERNELRPLNERIALMVGHAGSAIFITSFTDVVAFAIGASTILPSLQSFCIYAAVGVFVTFLLQITFFVAFFSLDTKRVESKRNGIVPCIVHADYEPRSSDDERISWRFTGFFYSRCVLTRYGKIVVLIVTVALAAFGVHGSTNLEQRFDPEWFLPEESYLREYLTETKERFPGLGQQGAIFMGEFNYLDNFQNIINMTRVLKKSNFIKNVEQWPINFHRFVKTNYKEDTLKLTEEKFRNYLSSFLFSKTGGKYQKNFRFNGNLTCGESVPPILVSSIDFRFSIFSTPTEWIAAMDGVKEICKNSYIEGFVTAWSQVFANWVTDKVIGQEVTRNLILALICVMATTAMLIAEVQTCLWIFICVLLTLLDVCGLMYHWGLTVDIVSCIGLELAVGLSIDYATHVAHAFLNSEATAAVQGSDHRTPRALNAVKHIGAAVVYGAGSTLLALSLLAFSEAYVFRSFFKIFFLVVFIGLWHGLMFLPVVLSTVGPRGVYQRGNQSADYRYEHSQKNGKRSRNYDKRDGLDQDCRLNDAETKSEPDIDVDLPLKSREC